jgi:hypothetical protein
MKNVFVVSKEQFDLARMVETKLLELAEWAILFVGASISEIVSTPEGWGMTVVVGCSRNLEVGTTEALVWAVISKEPELEAIKDHMKVIVYRGVARSPARSS